MNKVISNSKIKVKDPYMLFQQLKQKKYTSQNIIAKMKGSESTPLWNLAISRATEEHVSATDLFKMYNTMKKRHMKPNNHTYTYMFSYLAEKRAKSNNERLLKIFNQIQRPNEIHVNALFKAICMNGFYDTFFRLYGRMKNCNLLIRDPPLFTTIPVGVEIDKSRETISHFAATPQILKAAFGGISRCPIQIWKDSEAQQKAFKLLWSEVSYRIAKNEKTVDKLVKMAINDALRLNLIKENEKSDIVAILNKLNT